jgi:hypothetical protein
VGFQRASEEQEPREQSQTPKRNEDIEDYLRIMSYPNTAMAISFRTDSW